MCLKGILSRACCGLRRWTTAWRPLLPVLPDQRPALTGPRARRWARGVEPATFRRHGHLRRSAWGRGGSTDACSTSRTRRDARWTVDMCKMCMICRRPRWAGKLRVKTGLSTRPDGVGHTSLALCVEGDVMGVLCMAASCVRSTLPPLHPHPYSHGSLSAEICWFGAQHARHACDLGRARV